MIKLVDILKEIHQERQMEEGWKDIALGTAMTAASLLGTGGDVKAQTPTQLQKPGIEKTIAVNQEAELKKVLSKGPWVLKDEQGYYKQIYSFNTNGTVFIQGEGGEGAMSEGKWSLKGNVLTIIDTGFEGENRYIKKTFTIKFIKGKTPKEDKLILGDQVFKRDL